MLLCCESLLEIGSIQPHELTEGSESHSMSYIFHTFLICDYVVIKGH